MCLSFVIVGMNEKNDELRGRVILIQNIPFYHFYIFFKVIWCKTGQNKVQYVENFMKRSFLKRDIQKEAFYEKIWIYNFSWFFIMFLIFLDFFYFLINFLDLFSNDYSIFLDFSRIVRILKIRKSIFLACYNVAHWCGNAYVWCKDVVLWHLIRANLALKG